MKSDIDNKINMAARESAGEFSKKRTADAYQGGSRSWDSNHNMPNKTRKVLKEVMYYVIVILLAVIIRAVFIINAYTPTGSMENTVPSGARHFGLKCAYWFSEPERGDIIVFDSPVEEGTELLKRVIGLPGETVEIKEGVVYINGSALKEDYLKETPKAEDWGPFVVPEDCVFVLGDNRNNSYDARYWEDHCISYDSILGKAYFIYWPVSSMKWLY